MLGKMKLLTRNCVKCKKIIFSKNYCTEPIYKYPSEEDEYTSTPQYPPIEKYGEEEKEQKAYFDKIKRQRTVEEKLFEINVPRFYGWKCFMVREGIIPFNNLAFSQHMTRTHLIKTETLPEYYYGESFKKCSALAKEIKNYVIEAIEYQLQVRREKLFHDLDEVQKEKEITKIIVNELNRVILDSIGTDECHLKSIQTDFTPRMEAFWKINSLRETVVKKEFKNGIPLEELPEEYLDRPSDKFIQYIGNPILQLRHAHPLPKLMDQKEANIFGYSVPVYEYDPHTVLGYEMERRHVTNIPGFWPGDDREFSFLSYHFLNHIKRRPASYGVADSDEAIQSQVLFASFGWLMALSSYQGFSTYHDVTYPLVTQTVLTDGMKFVFGAYQLNTTETYHENPFENPRCNLCWITPAKPLFEAYEDGKLKGFDEGVLRELLQFYVNQPEPITDFKLKPYLGEKVKRVADYEDVEKREWLESKFKHISANKPASRPDLMYEVQDWERIFKIQFRMRPQDARRRPFELRQNPYHRKMSDDKGKYIPKALRPDKNLPKWRQRKFAKTFYPE